MRNSAFNFKTKKFMVTALLVIGSLIDSTWAGEVALGPQNWSEFQARIKEDSQSSSQQGTALLVSSALLVGGSYLVRVQDPVQVGAVSLIRTVGILGIGEGAESVWILDQNRIFQQAMDRAAGLSPELKSQVLRTYLELQAEQERKQNSIKAVTYSLVAAVNFYEGSRQGDDTIKTGLYFLGAVGLLRALTLTFDF